MNHLTNFAVLLAFCAIVAARIISRVPESRRKLQEAARLEELLPKLLPYSYHGDRARLLAEIRGVSGLRALHQACRATAALIERREGSGVIRSQTRCYSIQARWMIRGAIVETVVRRLFPAWSPVFLIAAVQIYCELAVTYEALVSMV